MMHDLKAFSRNIVSLIKTSGDTGDTGDKSQKSLQHNDNFVPTACATVSPVDLDWRQDVSSSGDGNIEKNHGVARGVPSVPTVASSFAEGEEGAASRNYPAQWHAILAELSQRPSADSFSSQHWQDIILDTRRFLRTWGSTASQLGWTALDLFSVNPAAPGPRVGCWGLLLFIRGGSVIALTDGGATIRRPSQSVLTFQRRSHSDEILLSEVSHEAA